MEDSHQFKNLVQFVYTNLGSTPSNCTDGSEKVAHTGKSSATSEYLQHKSCRAVLHTLTNPVNIELC